MCKEYENLKKQRCLQVVQECARSGKSKREWCAENGIGYSTFMRWQKRLREELAGAVLASQEIVPVEVEVPERFSRWNTGSAEQRLGLRFTKKALRSVPAISAFAYPRIHRQTIWPAW